MSLQVKDMLAGVENDIRSINRYRDFFSAPPEVQRQWLLELLASLPAVREIAFAGPDGIQRVKVSTFKAYDLDMQSDLSGRPEFQEVVRSQGRAFGSVAIDPDVGEPLMPLAIAPARPPHGRKPGRFMLCMLRLGAFLDLVTEFSSPPDVGSDHHRPRRTHSGRPGFFPGPGRPAFYGRRPARAGSRSGRRIRPFRGHARDSGRSRALGRGRGDRQGRRCARFTGCLASTPWCCAAR